MKPRHFDLEIPTDDPFLNCRLGRKKDAEILTNIVNNYRDGCTIALTGRWGSGKTTFLKMWEQYIRNNGQKVLYLNAWENDYIPEPLVCIIGEMESVFPAEQQKTIVKAAKGIFHILKKIPYTLALDFVDHKVGSETKDLIKETVSEKQDKVFENELSEYKVKKDGLTRFKSVLENAVSSMKAENPVVFIVDELDRCRPDYAVEVLEIIKHFFSVPGIVFILSIDKDQLANSVRGYYGRDRIDAEEYLRRFIDIEYSLPDPEIKPFIGYLYDYFEFSTFFDSARRSEELNFNADHSIFLEAAEDICSSRHLTCRQTEKLFAYTRLVLSSFNINQLVFPGLLLCLIYFKMFHPELYLRITRNEISINGLSDEFDKIFHAEITKENSSRSRPDILIYIFCQLIYFYAQLNSKDNAQLIAYLPDNNGKILTFDQHDFNSEHCITILEKLDSNMNTSRIRLTALTSRIDLLYGKIVS